MEDITKIDIDAFMKAHPEENFLSSADIDFIRVKIGKSHVGRRDWEQVQDRMAGHSLFVMRPAGTISFIRTVERYLVDGNRLVLFTNLTDCREYLNRILEQNGPGDWKIQIGDIKVEEALAFARQHDLFAESQIRKCFGTVGLTRGGPARRAGGALCHDKDSQ